MASMKTTLLALCLTFSACGSVGVQEASPPELAADATALEVFEGWRSFAVDTDRRVFVHLGAPW